MPMSGNDPWNRTDGLDTEVLDAMVARLEARGADQHFMAMLDEYLDASDIDRSGSVLDLGCGTGVVVRQIARRKSFSGRLVGIDLSPYLIDAAVAIAGQEGVADRIEFGVGDTTSLELADGSFDTVIAHTLFSHVDDPAAVLAECARVTRPGGAIIVFDGDWASMNFAQDNPLLAKANSEKLIAADVTQPFVMRQMPRYARRAGLVVAKLLPNVIAEAGKAEFWASAFDSYRQFGPASGVMSSDEANAWADEQVQASEDGSFFGASVFYTYILEKPAG